MVRGSASAGLALILAAGLAGCSASSVMEKLPESMGGLPSNAPARPATPYAYPAVHDMPPPRTVKPMTEEEQIKAEKALTAVRTRQEADKESDDDDMDAPKNDAAKNVAPAAKKKPAGRKVGGAGSADTGAKTNP